MKSIAYLLPLYTYIYIYPPRKKISYFCLPEDVLILRVIRWKRRRRRKKEKSKFDRNPRLQTTLCNPVKTLLSLRGIAARISCRILYGSVKPRCLNQALFNPETKSIFVEILFAPDFIEMHTLLYCILYIILHLRQRVRACTYYISYCIILFCWQISL